MSDAPLSPVRMLAEEVDGPDRAVIATDALGTVVYWGVGAEAMYGWTAGEALGRPITELTPQDMSEAEGIMDALKAGDPWSGVFDVRRKDGHHFRARVTDVPVHDARGQLLGIVGISRPVLPSQDA